MTAPRFARGQALVEFALAATVFFAFVFGIIEFGRALYQYDLLGQAARVGSRYASVNTPKGSDCGTAYAAGGACQTAIVNYLASKTGLDANDLIVDSATPTNGTTICFGDAAVADCPTTPGTGACATNPTVGCAVTIDLKYRYRWILLPFGTQTFSSTSSAVLTSQ